MNLIIFITKKAWSLGDGKIIASLFDGTVYYGPTYHGNRVHAPTQFGDIQSAPFT